MFRIVSIVLYGDSPVGTGTNVRIQFAPSPDVPRLTAMTRGALPGGGLGGDLPKTMAAATPAKQPRFRPRGPRRGGSSSPTQAAVTEATSSQEAPESFPARDPGSAVPHREQNRFADEFGVPQRGHTAVADVQALQPVE